MSIESSAADASKTEQNSTDSGVDYFPQDKIETLVENHLKKLGTDQLDKIIDMPYFSYLIEKKAKAQARTFLVGIASIILAVLAYGGYEFKSVRDEIGKQKAEIEKQENDIKLKITEIQGEAVQAKGQVDLAQGLVNRAEDFRKTSEEQSKKLLDTAQTQLSSSTSQQRLLFEIQRESSTRFFSDISQSLRDAQAVQTDLKQTFNEIKDQKIHEQA